MRVLEPLGPIFSQKVRKLLLKTSQDYLDLMSLSTTKKSPVGQVHLLGPL